MPIAFRSLDQREHKVMLERSRIIAVFLEIGGAYGLDVNSDSLPTREEKNALIRAARALPTKD